MTLLSDQMMRAIVKLFLSYDDLETDEEIEAALRECGYDPAELSQETPDTDKEQD